jgi:hypothetical protein
VNVKELIQLLRKHPPEMRVIVDGYEGGYDAGFEAVYDDIRGLEVENIALNAHEDGYCGPHSDAGDSPGEAALRLVPAREPL